MTKIGFSQCFVMVTNESCLILVALKLNIEHLKVKGYALSCVK